MLPRPKWLLSNEVLNQSLNIVRSLVELTKIMCVFDQALYAKVAEVTCKQPDKFKTTIIIRLRVSTQYAHCWQLLRNDFRMLDCESGVIAGGSISGVMDGRKYNRAVRLHKLVYEALIRLAWKGFLSWWQADHTDDEVHVDETPKTISNLCKDLPQASLKQVLQNRSCARIMYLFEI